MRATHRRRWCCRLAAGVLVLLGCSGGGSQTAEAQSRRFAALVVDANTGRVISETSPDEPRYPASLTKMMTLYVVFDLIEQRRLSYDTRIAVSEEAASVQPTKLGVPAGQSLTVLDVVKGLITKSANDAAVAIAEHVAGSEEKFAALMTQTARRIGMPATTFRNAHGLPHPGQVTTARDMITLGLRLQDDFPQHYRHFATRDFVHRGITHRNHNTLLGTYEGTDGIKTGYIGSSGFNLVANVRRNGRHAIGVVFGGPSPTARNATMKTLLNLALLKGSTTRTRAIAPMARGRPVPSPTVAARPEPPPVAKAAPAMAPVPPLISDDGPAVAVARVRPVLVAPREPRPAPAEMVEAPVQVTALAPSASPSPVRPVARPLQIPDPATNAPPLRQEPAAVPALGARPSTLAQQSANLARGLAPHAETPAVVSPPVRTAQAPLAVAARLNGPAPTSGVHIQIGAFGSAIEAERMLAGVRANAVDLVGNFEPRTIAAQVNGKDVFRARFVGVDPAVAGRACNDLRRRQIDCLVIKPD